MNTASVDLRPLGLGEILDRSVHFWRAHLGSLFGFFLAVQLIVYALQKAFRLLMAPFLSKLQDSTALTQALSNNPVETALELTLFVMGSIVLTAVTLWVVSVGAANVASYSFEHVTGRKQTMSQVWSRTRTQLGKLTLVLLLSLLAGIGAMLLATLPGVLTFGVAIALKSEGPAGLIFGLLATGITLLGYFLALVWWVVRFLVLPLVVVAESRGVLETYRRSGELMKGRIGPNFMDGVKVRATILLTVMTLIVISATVVGSLPQWILMYVYSFKWGQDIDLHHLVPQYVLVPAELMQVGVTALVMPLQAIFVTFFYLDVRVRREGLDLELQARNASAPAVEQPLPSVS